MAYRIEYTDYYEQWFVNLSEADQIAVGAAVFLLSERGPALPFPYSSGVKGSKHSRMRELRKQYKGKVYRILYAFDPERSAVLLLGGDKIGDKRWYIENVPIADRLYDEHISELERRKKGNTK
jgi:hypothetical protein